MHNGMIANLAWNRYEWKKADINPDVGQKPLKENPGHESWNFKFKEEMDDDTWIHGYFNRPKEPVQFKNGGVIFFISRNPDGGKKFIVGVYGGAELYSQKNHRGHDEFEDGVYQTNVRAKRDLSFVLFMPRRFKDSCIRKKPISQAGFVYLDEDESRCILNDMLEDCSAQVRSQLGKIVDYFAPS